MKNLFGLFSALSISFSSFGQTTAMNFNKPDCNGTIQHLFAELDAGNAIIVEFFMTSCSPCITAGNKLEEMKTRLNAEFPGKIKSYAFGYSNTYSCTTIKNWVSSNGFTSIPMDSGGAQVAYYGGMGMPTIVILGGGTAHSVLGSPYIGFATSDTTTMSNDIRNFLNSLTSVSDNKSVPIKMDIYPNPVSDRLNVKFNLEQPSVLKIDFTDITGRLVKNSFYQDRIVGSFRETLDISDLAKGLYVLRIKVNDSVSEHKINIIR